MNKFVKVLLTVGCIIGVFLSFFHVLDFYKHLIGEATAPVYINVEIEKEYAANLSIHMTGQDKLYWPHPTTPYWNNTKNIIMAAHFSEDVFYLGFSLRIPESYAAKTLNAIDNMTVFDGNKVFYFSGDDLRNMKAKSEGNYVFITPPNIAYTPSYIIKNMTNYYGDFNFALLGICNFFIYPARYAATWFFLLCLMFIYRKQIQEIYRRLTKINSVYTSAVLMIILIGFSFSLRYVGYTRHSNWDDELYTATRSGNPQKPWLNTFSDFGNPPFFYILIRIWFNLFGWTEQSASMLPVILGSLAVAALYFMIKPYFGRKTAFLGAFFMSICSFSIGYSNETRPYILKMLLAPLITIFFLRMLDKPRLKDAAAYILLSIIIVNSHHYGSLFILAAFVFYILYHILNMTFKWRDFVKYLLCDIIIALSLIPYLFYQVFIEKYNLYRTNWDFSPELTVIMAVILIFSFGAFYYRKNISNSPIFKQNKTQLVFCAYCVFIPCLIFTLAYLISSVKPMIALHYITPISFPFFLSLAVVFIYYCSKQKTARLFCIFLISAFALSLSQTIHEGFGEAKIPAFGTSPYKEAREYIAYDSSSNMERYQLKSAMLDNAPELAKYYGVPPLPKYSEDKDFDILYVFNNLFNMNQPGMYTELENHGIGTDNILKIQVNADSFVFKKYLKNKETKNEI